MPAFHSASISTKMLQQLGGVTVIGPLLTGIAGSVQIALWLGHESTNTTHRYVEADLAMKEKALARLEAPDTKLCRFRAPDSLMRFLQTL